MTSTFLRYLQGLNWALLAVAATFTAVLPVVCLLIYVHLDEAPRYQASFDYVLKITTVFVMLLAAAAVAVWTHQRQHFLRWPAELVLLGAVVYVFLFVSPK